MAAISLFPYSPSSFLRVHVDMCYKRMISLAFSKQNLKLGLVVDTVIEAIAKLEFEDGSPP